MLWRELDQGPGKWGPFSCLRTPSGLGGTATALGGTCGCFLSTSVGLWWSPSVFLLPQALVSRLLRGCDRAWVSRTPARC